MVLRSFSMVFVRFWLFGGSLGSAEAFRELQRVHDVILRHGLRLHARGVLRGATEVRPRGVSGARNARKRAGAALCSLNMP